MSVQLWHPGQREVDQDQQCLHVVVSGNPLEGGPIWAHDVGGRGRCLAGDLDSFLDRRRRVSTLIWTHGAGPFMALLPTLASCLDLHPPRAQTSNRWPTFGPVLER